MMSTETDSATDSEDGSIPAETITGFLNAVRDGYVNTEETRFHDDGSVRIVLTQTHQGAFKSAANTARRFGIVPSGNRDAGGQRFQHIAGTTPNLRAEYKPDAYNVVMVGNPSYTGPLPYDPHPVKAAVSFFEAVEHAEHARENYRDDVEYRVQSCETQELIPRESEHTGEKRISGDGDGDVRTDGGVVGQENPDEVSEDDLPESVPDLIRGKVAATINLALGDMVETSLVEAADIGGLKYEKLAEIARETGLDVDEMNATGLGIADSADDIQRPDPDATHERFCGNCNGMVHMDVWKGSRAGFQTMSVTCQNCGEGGSRWDDGIGDPIHSGILLDSEERDERLQDLRERGVHPQVSERAGGDA